MEYRELGNTGILVSEIGMGCEGFIGKTAAQTKAYVDAMEESGINCIDLYSPNPLFRSSLGEALEGRRDRFVLQAHLCTIWRNGQYLRTRNLALTKQSFEDQLTRIGTDHFEIGMIHYVDALGDWQTVLDNGILDYALELKASGVIRAVGLSSHNPKVAIEAVESGNIDVLMFSVNPCYDLLPGSEDCYALFEESSYADPLVNMDPQRQRLYELCQERGVGITVMKAFGGGDLLRAELSPAGVAMTPAQCIHYALTRPGVASVMCGGKSVDEIREAAAYADALEEARDYAPVLASMPRISWEGHCMYCGHCAPCPAGISVADVTKFLNLTRAQGTVPETVREHYKSLAHHASDCIGCGSCESRCPFGVSVTDNMKTAKEVFGY